MKSSDDVELTLLWRGVETAHIKQLRESYDLKERVKLIDSEVDVQGYFDQCHVTILMCDIAGVLKNYPHSLMESICSGRSVILNNFIEFSSIVDQHQLGIVIESCQKHLLESAIHKLKTHCEDYLSNCRAFNTSLFDRLNYHDKLRSVYTQALNG